jgi:Type II secretion system (T2SS), protein M subtype b
MSAFVFMKPALPRIVALSAAYGLAGLFTLLALVLMSGNDDRRASIAEMEAVIARAETAAAGGGSGLGPTAFYTGDTPQLAQAALQTDLQALAETHSIEIEVIRADQIEQIDGFVRLNLTLNGVAPETELGPFLHGLASMEPIVVVEQLNLRRARTSRTEAERKVTFQAELFGVSDR